MTNEVKAKKLINRINKISVEFWSRSKTKGITHSEWCIFYYSMMRLGERLKSTGIKYNPRSKNYPTEFRELFK